MNTETQVKELRVNRTLTLSYVTASALRTAAFQEDRTMSDIVEAALTDWLTRHRYLPTEVNDAATN